MRADGRPYISRRRRAADQADLDGRWAFHVEGVRTPRVLCIILCIIILEYVQYAYSRRVVLATLHTTRE